jgi:hypothetical protein
MAVAWITVDEAQVLGVMSPVDLPGYNAWIAANPGRAGRLAALTSQVRAEFRAGIATNPVNVLDPDETKLPETCVRYCDMLVIFYLKVEMWATLSGGELMAIEKAEIFLRQLFYSHFVVAADEAGGRSPSYEADVERTERVLEE